MRLALVLAVLAALAFPALAPASPYLRAGVQDDAWLQYGPGTLSDRLDRLDALGVDVVRVTIDWRDTEPVRGKDDWSRADLLLNGLHERGIAPLVTLWGTPGWANGAPRCELGADVEVDVRGLRAPRRRALPVRAPLGDLERAEPAALAASHVTARVRATAAQPGVRRDSPREPAARRSPAASRRRVDRRGGVSPVDWITGMKTAHARLDAYAHNPYPLSPGETPTSGGCGHCATITMATLPRLLTDVRKAFGTRTRIWLTEYGYQTNPPDRLLGVSYAKQAQYTAEAALRAYLAPRVDILIHYLVRDEPDPARWQSGFFTARDFAKPAYNAFRFPLVERARTGLRTTLWGQIRPGGSSSYRLQQFRSGTWATVGVYRTSARGYFMRTVRAGAGARFRIWSVAERAASPVLTVR